MAVTCHCAMNADGSKELPHDADCPVHGDPTVVIFRMDTVRIGDASPPEVVAVFPELPANPAGDMVCYAHVGQHSSCTKGWYRTTRPAHVWEYVALERELYQQGYRRLDIRKKITRAMDEAREAAARG